MKRSLFCPFELLNRTQSFPSDDWRLAVLRRLCSIYIPYEDLKGCFSNFVLSEGETVDALLKLYNQENTPDSLTFDDFYINRDDYREVSGKTAINIDDQFISDLEELRDSFGNCLRIATSIRPDLYFNGALCGIDEDSYSLSTHGILCFDGERDGQVSVLQRGWYEEPDPFGEDTSFSWSSFFGSELPVSNSVIITDRYLLQTKKRNPEFFMKSGVKDLIEILNCIIPKHFSEIYYVTIVFEYEQLVWDKQWKNSIPVAECLNRISRAILEGLNYKKTQINYIAIKDPNKQSLHPNKQLWYDLHKQYFHDRRIITNYFWVIATAALNATEKKDDSEETKASRFQHIQFFSLFNGADNPRQKLLHLPFFKLDKYLDTLSSFIKAIPSQAYECYRYNSTLKQIKKGKEELIESNLLDFR